MQKKIDEIREYAESFLSEKRFRHTMNVAEEARRLAEIWGEDAEKAYVAGLIHDLGKEVPREETKRILFEKGEIDEPSGAFPDVALHGFLGAYIAKERFGICDEDILSAARYHTTGRLSMSLLEKIIYVADFTEPGRKFPQAAEVRKISERDIDEAVLREADYVIKFNIDAGRFLYLTTVEVRNSFLMKKKEDR